MNREDIIRMAREAGIEWDLIDDDEGQIWYISADGLQRFAALVAAAEREACAKLLESRRSGANELMDATREMEAYAIRARGQAAKTCPPCHGDCNQGRACPARGGHA